MKSIPLLFVPVLTLACGDPGLTHDADVATGFDDHTVPGFASAAALLAHAGPSQAPAQVKFVLTGFDGGAPLALFMESGFYSLHDEWAWFRLLNGHDVPDLDLTPVQGRVFATIADVVAWARDWPNPLTLPLGLQWAGERLYLKRFYDRAFGVDRRLGIGSVLHYAADPKRKLPGELWLFELEYVDKADAAMIGRFFTALEAALPPDVAPKLAWLVRATWQQTVADELKAAGSPYADRVVTYDDLVVEGAWEVYNPGLTAGIVKLVPKGEFASALLTENHLVVLAEVPDQVMALTVKAYVEHLQALPLSLPALLADAEFVANARVRLLALEGEAAFRDEFAGLPETLTWLDGFLADHAGADTELTRAIALGGVREAIEDAPVAPDTLAAIEAALAEHFAFLAPRQGLRFRSSSTAEDIEGFNGAGLYDSNTGYLQPELQSDPDKKKRTIAWALRKTWSSYWLQGAFEERRAAGIDHLSGRMAAAVHPVFDDDHELANGVLTLELVRRPGGDVTTLTVNVQQGSLSVTNPPVGSNAAPEIDVVRQEGGAAPVLTRVQASTEVAAGEVLLSDAELFELHARLSGLAGSWLDVRNEHYVKPQRDSTMLLDLELKRMAEGWPALADGTSRPERLVYKQARTLHDSTRHAATVQTLPIPRDVLGKTTRVVKRTCTGPDLTLVTAEAFTDPTRPWPFEHGKAPFSAYVVLQFATWPPWLPVPEGTMLSVMHTDATSLTHPGMADTGAWSLDLQVAPPSKVGFDRLQIDPDGAWKMLVGEEAHGGAGLTCTTADLLITPQAYLEELL